MSEQRSLNARNLILTGFMGTGKSAVGQLVAERLGRDFMDTDRLIETRTGRSIPDLFAQEGEAHFRALEAEVCRELSARRGLVIATGGWTLGTPANRAALEASGLVVCLSAEVPALLQRLGAPEGRPKLQDPAWQARLVSLLTERQATYLSFPLRVDTTRRSVAQTAEAVLALWAAFADGQPPRALPVLSGGTGYAVLIGRRSLERAGPLIDGLGPWTTIAVICDETVAALHASHLAAALAPAKATDLHPVTFCHMPAGETHKTLQTVAQLYRQLLAAGLDRRGLVVALGGGVVGDVAGFVAATYMRGVPLVQVPTTLLAMVDSSVGGKVGVDLPEGKNLAGVFKQPSLVLIDPQLLATLPAAELRAGLAEVIKAGVIGSPALFERLEQCQPEQLWAGLRPAADSQSTSPTTDPDEDNLAWIIHQAVLVKVEVVQADPYEQGRRAVLNLGHTFGHAFEVLSDFQWRHGEAIAAGMACAARLAAALGYCRPEVAQRISALLRRFGLPTQPPRYPPEAVLSAMASDKKKQGSRLRFVLPRAIGQVEIFDDVPKAALINLLTACPDG